MKNRKQILLPTAQRGLSEMGENIKLARKRRRLSLEQVAERAHISRMTLWNVENGSASVAIGTYFRVLFVLGLEKDMLKIASEDPLGRKLQDAELINRRIS
jgi:transcriptional regulator with XRE-family HTH domain